MADPLIRQWELLKLIPRDRKITVRELKDKLNNLGFNVTRRTIERDLERLSVPFCLESDERSKPYGWRFSPNTKAPSIPGLHANEALTLLLLQDHLTNLLPVAIADSLNCQFYAARHYFEQELPDVKLRDWLKKVKVVSPGQPLMSPEWPSEHQRVVSDALLQGLQLDMYYLKAGAEQVKHYERVHLHGLIQYGHVIYLVVTINEYDDPRLLLLHRIQKVKITQSPIRLIPDFDLECFIEKGGLGFGGAAKTIQLIAKLKNSVGHYLIETPLSLDQTIKRQDENTIVITATLQETAKLHWWLMQFGPDIEIMAPAELRNYISDRHRQAVLEFDTE